MSAARQWQIWCTKTVSKEWLEDTGAHHLLF